ncbi:hypothetical protein GCM10020331_067380 [Ectobacillus funiculus]
MRDDKAGKAAPARRRCVIFLGKQDNVEELLSMSDLLLLLSEKESFGLVLLEAMFCGVPCIGTNVGGIPEVIRDGETGFICELGDVRDIAEKGLACFNKSNITCGDGNAFNGYGEGALPFESHCFSIRRFVL